MFPRDQVIDYTKFIRSWFWQIKAISEEKIQAIKEKIIIEMNKRMKNERPYSCTYRVRMVLTKSIKIQEIICNNTSMIIFLVLLHGTKICTFSL